MQVTYVHAGVSGAKLHAGVDLSSAVAAGVAAPSALDAVEAAIRILEDDGSHNAGRGATVTRSGTMELDAGIADGASGDFGGVTGVTVRHPISLARRVLETTPHALIAGDGAIEMGTDMEQIGPTAHQLETWRRALAANEFERGYAAPEHVETVGAVALDSVGGLAAGSSTGGVFGKLRGRVGDAPIFGAGFYATASVAVVGTGVGELFLKSLAAARIGDLIDEGVAPQIACEKIIERLGKIDAIPAGLLALSSDGRVGAAFRGASWVVEGPDGPINARRLY